MQEHLADDRLSDETVLRAISVFGARVRGAHSPDDTPELAAELQRRWEAEGHGPVPGFAPGSLADRAWQRARAVAARLPEGWQARLRLLVRRARASLRR